MNRFLTIACIFFLTCALATAQNINRQNISCPMGLNVNSFSGNLFFQRTDLYINGRIPFNFTFYYNSSSHALDNGYGKGWTMEYLMKYVATASGVTFTRGDGYGMSFEQTGANAYKPAEGIFDSLSNYDTGKLVLITKEKMKYFFENNTHKRLTKMEDRNGNMLTFEYTDTLLKKVTDGSGRSITLTYSGGRLTEIKDDLDQPTRKISYTYDSGTGTLTAVTDPLGNQFKYDYLINGPLNRLTDKNGNVADIVYNSEYLVKEVITCNSNQRFSFDKLSGTTLSIEQVSGQNQTTTYKYDSKGRIIQKEGNCCGFNIQFEYDGNGNISKFTDANGNVSTYAYDAKGNMLLKTDPMGNTVTATFNNFSMIKSFTDKNGNITVFDYDGHGNLLTISYPLGIINSFTYSSNGDQTSFKNGRGFTTTFEYDVNGNIISENKPLSVTIIYEYDDRSRLLSETIPLNHKFYYEYSDVDQIVSITDPLNNKTVFTYDPNGNLLSRTDPLNHATEFAYDALDRRVKRTNALDKSRSWSYNERSVKLLSVDENGSATQYAYDDLNRLISKTNAANETTIYEWNKNATIKSIIYPNGNEETFSYDALDRMISRNDLLGMILSLSYDNEDNILHSTDGNNFITHYSYDELNRRISATDPLGKVTTYGYDKNSNLISITDRNNHKTTYTYDDLDRRVTETDPLNNTTTYTYDDADNLTSITDANTNITAFTYDELNRKTGESYPEGIPKTNTYDAVGNVLTRTDGKGTTNYTYDAVNRLLLRDFPTSPDESFTYDYGGRMLTASTDGASIAFAYDAADRLKSETLNGKTTAYNYDISGKRRELEYPGGRIITEQYDERNLLLNISENSSVIAAFSYDPSDRNVAVKYSNGTSTNTLYDANNRIIEMFVNSTSIPSLEYSYDNTGNALFEENNSHSESSRQYEYDNANQLINYKVGMLSGSTIPNPSTETQYVYDEVGNRLSMTLNSIETSYETNALNQYTSIVGQAIIDPTYDSNGNLTHDGTYNFSYNEENRLIKVNNGEIAEYRYDALGRRIQKILPSETINYYYAGEHVIEQRDFDDTLKSSFVYEVGIDNILTIQYNGSSYFYHKNILGSTIALSNSAGLLVERYEYDAFGKPLIFDDKDSLITTSAYSNTIFFTGREFNHEVYNYHYRARTYEEDIGKFLQRDPIGFDGGLNLYSYVNNNPTNLIDPWGLQSESNDETKDDEDNDEAEGDQGTIDEKEHYCSKMRNPKAKKSCEEYYIVRSECFKDCKKAGSANSIIYKVCKYAAKRCGLPVCPIPLFEPLNEKIYGDLCPKTCENNFPKGAHDIF